MSKLKYIFQKLISSHLGKAIIVGATLAIIISVVGAYKRSDYGGLLVSRDTAFKAKPSGESISDAVAQVDGDLTQQSSGWRREPPGLVRLINENDKVLIGSASVPFDQMSKLNVDGSVRLPPNGSFIIGNSNNPFLNFEIVNRIRQDSEINSPNDLIFFTTDDPSLRSEKMRLANNGNLGLGTGSNPRTKLQLDFSSDAVGDSSNGLTIQNRSFTGDAAIIFRRGGLAKANIRSTGLDSLDLATGGEGTQTRLRITSIGQVLIGTFSPDDLETKLEVLGKASASEVCIAGDCRNSWPTGGNGGVWRRSLSGLVSLVNPDDTITIGTGSFQPAKLNVNGVLRSKDFFIDGNIVLSGASVARQIQYGSERDSDRDRFGIQIAGGAVASPLSGAVLQVYGNLNNPNPGRVHIDSGDVNGAAIIFRTGGDGSAFSERMRITSMGLVGIGIGNPATALDVRGTIAADSFVGGQFTASGSMRFFVRRLGIEGGNILALSPDQRREGNLVITGTTNIVFRIGATDFALEHMRIASNGNVGIGLVERSPSAKLEVAGSVKLRFVPKGGKTLRQLCLDEEDQIVVCQ